VPDSADVVLETFALLASKARPTRVLVVTDRPELATAVRGASEVPLLVATSNRDVADEAGGRGARVLHLADPLASGLALFPQIKEILLNAYLDGSVAPEDRVLCLAGSGEALDVIVLFDVARDLELGHLREEIGARVSMALVERVLRLAAELSREGREGKPVGTLFVLGDSDAVLGHSRQAVLNPFEGHPPAARNLLADDAWETVKEFAQLDGAFVIREDGVVLAAGRYVQLDHAGELQAGLGGRHLAAASITRATRAIAVAISSNGAIRVFKDGRVVMMVGKL